MDGIDPYIELGVVLILALGGGWLLFKGKLGSFLFEKDKEKIKVEIKAPENSTAAILSSDPTPARDRIESKGDVHVHNYPLDAGSIRQMLQEELKEVKKELGSGTKDQQENEILKKQIGGLEAKLADTEKALEDHKIVLTETQEALESAELKNAVSEGQLSDALEKLEQGDSSEAEDLLTQVLNKAETHVNAGAEAAYRLGKLAYDRIDYRAARDYYVRATQLFPENVIYQGEAGVLASTLGSYDKAIEHYLKAAENCRNNLGENHPHMATIFNNLGEVCRKKGQYDEAIQYNEKALAIDLETFGPANPRVAIKWNNLGAVWSDKGRNDKAIKYYEKALASDLKTFGPEHPNVATRWNNLGEVWRDKGDYDKAIEYYEKALASDLKTYGPEHPKVAIYFTNLGVAWSRNERCDKAIEYHQKAIKSWQKNLGDGHPNVARGWQNLGGAWCDKGHFDKAIKYFDNALSCDLKTFGSEHPNVAGDLNNLGFAFSRKGNNKKAIKYYKEALAIYEKANLPHKVQMVQKNIADLKNQR
jgi:tetratricopeptide (TPR) repeat protein